MVRFPILSSFPQGRGPFARRDVSRGLSEDEVAVYNTWTKAHELKEPFFAWYAISLFCMAHDLTSGARREGTICQAILSPLLFRRSFLASDLKH